MSGVTINSVPIYRDGRPLTAGEIVAGEVVTVRWPERCGDPAEFVSSEPMCKRSRGWRRHVRRLKSHKRKASK
jgi:hypothetical protein